MKDPNYSQMPYPYPAGEPHKQVRSPRDTLIMIAILALVLVALIIVVNIMR